MSGPDEGFLSRWSRRKRSGEEAAPDAADEEQHKSEEQQTDRPGESVDAEPQSAKQAEPAFDISKLPPIESITAETDIRVFLAPGVPPALTQAALRRAWVADPKIRDFIEMAENQWNFNAPGVAGFDLSPPTGDVARMLADIIGGDSTSESPVEKPAAASAGQGEPAASASSRNIESLANQTTREPKLMAVPTVGTQASGPNSEKETVRRALLAEEHEPDHAPQQNDAAQNSRQSIQKRTHGRAMPR